MILWSVVNCLWFIGKKSQILVRGKLPSLCLGEKERNKEREREKL